MMAFKVISEPKMPRPEDISLGSAHWDAETAKARCGLRRSEDSRARRRYMERISFCEVAAYRDREGGK